MIKYNEKTIVIAQKSGPHKNTTAWNNSSRRRKNWQLVESQKSSAVRVMKIVFEQFHF
jgi:hypothetical protein